MPKRDLLPSTRPDHVTKALDETYERGFRLGRSAGLERACQLLRDAPYSVETVKLLELLTREKYQQ